MAVTVCGEIKYYNICVLFEYVRIMLNYSTINDQLCKYNTF